MRCNLELFYIFFKIGLFTFGGGYAMIPQLKEIVVEKKKWITEDEMLEIAKSIDNVKSYLEGKEIIKVITIPKKLINIVIK